MSRKFDERAAVYWIAVVVGDRSVVRYSRRVLARLIMREGWRLYRFRGTAWSTLGDRFPPLSLRCLLMYLCVSLVSSPVAVSARFILTKIHHLAS